MAGTQDDLLNEVDDHIRAAEAHSTALTAAVIGLTTAGCDTTEAEALLRGTRNILASLRRQRWAIPARAKKPLSAALAEGDFSANDAPAQTSHP